MPNTTIALLYCQFPVGLFLFKVRQMAPGCRVAASWCAITMGGMALYKTALKYNSDENRTATGSATV
jgi:hypothetical protein